MTNTPNNQQQQQQNHANKQQQIVVAPSHLAPSATPAAIWRASKDGFDTSSLCQMLTRSLTQVFEQLYVELVFKSSQSLLSRSARTTSSDYSKSPERS